MAGLFEAQGTPGQVDAVLLKEVHLIGALKAEITSGNGGLYLALASVVDQLMAQENQDSL